MTSLGAAPPSLLAHKVALSSGLGIARQFVMLLGSIVVARMVGPEVLGTIAYAVAFVGLFASLSDFGFGTAHTKRVSEGWNLGQCMGMTWLAKAVAVLAMSVATAAAFAIGHDSAFDGSVQTTVFWLSLATAIAGQLSFVPITTLTAFQDVYRKDLPPAVVQIANAALRVGVAAFALGAIGLATVDLATSIVLTLFYVWLLRKLPIAWPSLITLRSYAIFGAPSFVIALLTSVGENMDRVLLHAFAGVTAVGEYSAGMRLGGMLQYLSLAVAGLVFPSLSRAYAEGRREAAFELCARAERRLALVLLPTILTLAGIANPLALLLLGERYADTGPVVVFGTMAMVFQILAQPLRQILAGGEKLLVLVAGHTIQFGVQAGMLYLLLASDAWLNDGPGAAPATAIAMAATALIGLTFWHAAVVRFLGAPVERATWVHIASTLVLFVPIYTSTLVFGRWSIVPVAVGAAGLLTHLAVLRTTGQLGTAEIAFLRSLAGLSGFSPSALVPSRPGELE